MNKAEDVGRRAEELFGGSGLYCAESVLKAVSEFSGIESPLIPKIATGFCGGMSRTKGTCGAVTGGVMALSLHFGRNDAGIPVDDAYVMVQEFLAAFQKLHGSINCFDLTRCGLGTPEGREQFRTSGTGNNTCRKLVGGAASTVAGLISQR